MVDGLAIVLAPIVMVLTQVSVLVMQLDERYDVQPPAHWMHGTVTACVVHEVEVAVVTACAVETTTIVDTLVIADQTVVVVGTVQVES